MPTENNGYSSPAAEQPKPETILVAEDDRICLKLVQAMLIDAGYGVHVASDGRQCLEKVSQVHPDLILMDVSMPHIDGIEACRQLKSDSDLRHVPVIIVTGSTDEETLQSAFAAGANDFVRKPVSRIELMARVGTVLSQIRMVRKMAEEEKLKGVLETAGGVCHELNQPLQYILGAVQLLMLDVDPGNTIYLHLDHIRARVEQMGEITRKLAEITRFRTRKYMGDRVIIDLDQSICGNPD